MATAREVFIRMSLLAMMGVSCYLLLRPFLSLIISGIIIAVAVFPAYRVLTKSLGGRENLAAVLCTVILLLVVIVPCLLLAGTLAEGIRTVVQQLQSGQVNIPPPPPKLASVPLVGRGLAEFWSQCSTNLSEAVSRFRPQIVKSVPALLSVSAAIGGALLQLLISILLAGFLLARSRANAAFAETLFARVFQDQGTDYKRLVAATIRSVTNGILGVAAIQSLFASLGFWFVRLPGAGLWAAVFIVAAVLQVGTLVLVPAVLYVFATSTTSHAVVFLVWCIFVGIMDNILKPILLGRGGQVPMAVIFLGVLGGFIAMRIVGLFVGAIILAVGYRLFVAWLHGAEAET
jgi:predicted PurR-regulated permease PerM